MADTIESFVKTLQAEGVEAGQSAAEEIRNEAEQKAQEILKQARNQAESIIADAKAEADSQAARHQKELNMAVRDAVLRLHEALIRSLEGVLTCPVESHLSNSDFLKPLLHDIVMQYARADSEGKGQININLGPDKYRQLADWAIGELRQAAQDHTTGLNLKDTLTEAGFEYQVSGATVDVTADSVVETLADLVGPQLRKILQESTEVVQS